MKIDDSLKIKSSLSGNQEAKSNKPSNAPVKAESNSEDKVTLSSRSSVLQELESKVMADEAFDVNKVQEIKAAILNGQFKIDTNKVANGLINSVKELLSAQNK
jgi:negative regulator of flagellin synthesis FlgM